MKSQKKTFILIIIFFINLLINLDNGIIAANPGADSVIIIKCQDFIITGDGVSGWWEKTGWINLPQVDQNKKEYQTRVKVLYSEKGIYFLFDCEDKKLVSSFKSDNMNLWTEDVVEVFLWTDESFPVYFEYEISPLNHELAIMVPNNKGNFLGWLPWHYEGERKTQHATSAVGGKKKSGASVTRWIAEFFIPYKLLSPLGQVPPKSGTRWRANMYRIDYDNGETAFAWQRVTGTFHEYGKFGTFIFE